MADLTDIQAAETVKIAGANPSTGVESYFVNVTSEGRVKTDLGYPTAAFGSLMTASLLPYVNLEPTHGLQERIFETYTNGTGSSVSIFDSGTGREFQASCGTSVGGYGLLRSKKVLKYRAGIGSMARFTARFTAPVANSGQRIGLGNIGNELTFGYDGTTFGILRKTGGRVEIRTLTLTNRATSAQTGTVTLNGIATGGISLTNSTIEQNAFEIAAAYSASTLWTAYNVGATIVFFGEALGSRSGTYSFSSTGAAAGSFTQQQAGQNATDNWVYQSSWNADKMDGTGESGMVLDPTKGNVYQIQFQYLGYGNLMFYIENPETGKLTLVHQIKYPNANTTTHLDYPGFKLAMFAFSAGSTTNLTIYSGSLAGFHENSNLYPRKIHSEIKSLTGVGTSLTSVLALKKLQTSNGLMDIRDIKFMDLAVAVDGTKPVVFKLLLNPTFASNQLYATFDEDTSIVVSSSGGTVSGGEQLYCGSLPKSGNIDIDVSNLDFVISSNDVIALCVQATASTTDATASCTWGEE